MTTAPLPDDAGKTVKDQIADLKKRQILDAAVQLFLDRGFHGTSVDSIASALGVSKQFVYYQFKDKQAILSALSVTGAELTLSAVHASDSLSGSPVDKMRDFCRRLAEIVITHGTYIAVYASEINNLRDDDRQRILAVRAEIDRRVGALIELGVTSGEFVSEDPLTAARAITGMISFMWTWGHPADPRGRELLVERMIALALRSLAVAV